MSENLPVVQRFLSYLLDERAFSPYTSRCYGLDLRQFVEHLESTLGRPADAAVEQAALDAALAKQPLPASITASILSCDVEQIRGFLDEADAGRVHAALGVPPVDQEPW